MPKERRCMSSDGEKTLLNRPSDKLCARNTLRAILKTCSGTGRGKNKTIVFQSVWQQKCTTASPVSFSSTNTVPGPVFTVSATIRGKSWSNAIELWLKEHPFVDVARMLTLSKNLEKLLAFVIVLRDCPNERDLFCDLFKACDNIVRGNRLLPHFLMRFDFAIYSREEIGQTRKEDRRFLSKKVAFDPEKDTMAIIHAKRCRPFKGLDGLKMDQQTEDMPSPGNSENAE